MSSQSLARASASIAVPSPRALSLILLLPALVRAEAAPPVLVGPVLLPGDQTVATAPAQEEAPFIAPGGGGFLAVWSDSRTNFTSPPPFYEEQSARDIYAARLDAAGNLIDVIPIAVNQDFGYQKGPLAAWNGQDWLVVWECQAPTEFYYASSIHAARIAADGTLRDAAPIRVVSYQNSSGAMYNVTSNGTDWLVVAEGTSAGENDLVGVRVSAGGTRLDPTPVVLVPAAYYLYFDVRVGYAGGEYLLTYDNLLDFRAQRFTTGLALAGTFTVPGLLIESNGTGYYAVWTSGTSFVGSPMTKEGVLTFPAGVTLAATADETGLAWDRSRWWFSLRDPAQGVVVRRITPGGSVIGPGGVAVDPTSAPYVRNHRIGGAPAGGAVVVWRDFRAGGPNMWDVRGAFVSAVGAPAPKGAVSQSAPAQLDADLAAGSGYLLAFRSEVSGIRRIMAQRLSAAGAAVDAEPLVLGSGPSLGKPAVAWNGTLYLVAWSDGSNVLAKRVTPMGTILDAAPIVVMPGITPDAAAVGDDFLVVGTHTPTDAHFRFPYSRRVDGPTGALLDGAPRPLGQYFAQYPRVAGVGTRWLAVWQRNFSHDDPQAELSGCFIETDGTAGPEFRSTTFVGSGFTPTVAFSGSEALVVYRTGSASVVSQDLKGLRIRPDGTFPGGTGGFAISSATDQQFNPAVTWTGTEFLVAWDDKRNAARFFDERTDVYGARVSEGGVVLDPAGFAVADSPFPEQLPAVAGRNGGAVLAASLFRSGTPFASYRIGTWLVDPQALDVAPDPGSRPRSGANVAWIRLPAPFRPGNEMGYELRTGGRVWLHLYDAAGRLVRTLVEGAAQPAGEHRVRWLGDDQSGGRVAPGVYFVRLTVGTSWSGRRLLLVR